MQGLIDYEMRKGRAVIALTSDGFKSAEAGAASASAPAASQPVAPQPSPFAPFVKRIRKDKQRAPTIMDELAPGGEAETGLKPTPEQFKRRMAESKMDYYLKRWKNVLIAGLVLLVLLLLVLVYVFVIGG